MKVNAAFLTALLAVFLGMPALGAAQATPADASTRLRAVLPAAVAERVLARIADARAKNLPAAALEQRALKFAAKGIAPADIERSVAEHADRLQRAKQALDVARGRRASADEVEAGAETLRLGVSGSAVSELARSAPSGRSLAVPLYVVGSLVSRGLPADSALARVRTRLVGRASDAEIEQLSTATEVDRGNAQAPGRPAVTGRDMAATRRPEHAGSGGPPAGVPRNAGAKGRPQIQKPTPGKKP